MKSLTAWSLIVFGLFLMPWAYGASAMTVDITTALNDGFRLFWDLLSHEYVAFGVTVIVLTVLIRNIFLAGLSKVPQFGDTKYASIISTMLALLSVLGIVFLKIQRGYSIKGVMEGILGPAGIYAVIFVTVMFYVWLHQSIGSKKMALAIAGLIGYALGSMIANELMMTIGIFTFLGGVVAFLIGRSKGSDYTDYKGNNPRNPSVGLGGMFGNKGGKTKAKDSVALIKDQLAALDREEKLGDQIRHTDDHVTQLEKMRDRLGSEEKIDLEKEQAILNELKVVFENVREIDKSLEEEERFYTRTGNQEALRKIAYLKSRRQDFVSLYEQLMRRLQEVTTDEQRILKEEERIDEIEKRDIDKEIVDSRGEVKGAELVVKDEIELEKDIQPAMIPREQQEERMEVDEEKAAGALEKTYENEAMIVRELEKIDKEMDRLHLAIKKEPTENNILRMQKDIPILAARKRELGRMMSELQKRDKLIRERTEKETKMIKQSKKTDVVFEKQEAR